MSKPFRGSATAAGIMSCSSILHDIHDIHKNVHIQSSIVNHHHHQLSIIIIIIIIIINRQSSSSIVNHHHHHHHHPHHHHNHHHHHHHHNHQSSIIIIIIIISKPCSLVSCFCYFKALNDVFACFSKASPRQKAASTHQRKRRSRTA